MGKSELDKKDEREDKYIHFPLCLLQMTYENPYGALNLILDYGIVYYAEKNIKCDPCDVSQQLMYAYYRQKDMIPPDLLDMIDSYIDTGELSTDSNDGFAVDGSFDPSESSEELIELFESDSIFRHEANRFYKVRQALKFLNLSGSSIDAMLERYNVGQKYRSSFEEKFGPDCFPSVKVTQVISFRDSGKDLDLFKASVAIRSLIGQNRWIATTKKVILMRMLGCKSADALLEFIGSNPKARTEFENCTRSDKALRYYFDKLFVRLLQHGFIRSKIFERKVSRKIFISVTLSYDQLADEISRYANSRNYKKNEMQARNKIRATI